MKIIIAAPSYNSSIGGVVVLHKLCHILNNLGYDSYLTTTLRLNGQTDFMYLNTAFNTKVIDSIDVDNDIIIYPEVQPGNPYGCKNVVRYILNTYHLPNQFNIMETWTDSDYWLYYHDRFYDGLRDKNMLHIIDSKIDIFEDKGLERKFSACFSYRKRDINKIDIIHPADSIEIGSNVHYDELISIFNNCRQFYSYDTETYLSVLAALCGCESIIVPIPGVDKDSIISAQPSFKYGIAYGLDELEWANSTRNLLVEHLQNLEDTQIQQTKIEFDKIIEFFKTR